MEVFDMIINFLGSMYPLFSKINNIIGQVIVYGLAYRAIYVVMGCFTTRKFKESTNYHKYAIVIAARKI